MKYEKNVIEISNIPLLIFGNDKYRCIKILNLSKINKQIFLKLQVHLGSGSSFQIPIVVLKIKCESHKIIPETEPNKIAVTLPVNKFGGIIFYKHE